MPRLPTSDQIAWLDDNDFLKAMKEYAEESGKDFAEAINQKMRDACLKASANAPVANKLAIEKGLTAKMVAGKLKRKPAKRERVKYWHYTGKKTKKGNPQRRGYYRWVTRHYSAREAYKYWRSITGRRKAAASFIKSFFVHMGHAVEMACPNIPKIMKPVKKSGHDMKYKPATAQDPNAVIDISYTYRKVKRANRVNEILNRYWNVGLGLTIIDAQQYIARKMRERAAKYSIK